MIFWSGLTIFTVKTRKRIKTKDVKSCLNLLLSLWIDIMNFNLSEHLCEARCQKWQKLMLAKKGLIGFTVPALLFSYFSDYVIEEEWRWIARIGTMLKSSAAKHFFQIGEDCFFLQMHLKPQPRTSTGQSLDSSIESNGTGFRKPRKSILAFQDKVRIFLSFLSERWNCKKVENKGLKKTEQKGRAGLVQNWY